MIMKRKTILINRTVQLKITFTVIGITIIAFLIIGGAVIFSAAVSGETVANSISDFNKTIESQDKIFNDLTAKVRFAKKEDKEKILALHRISMQSLRGNIEKLDAMIKKNFAIVSFIVGIVLAMGFVLYFYINKMTHRITGPLYVMSRQMDDVLENKEPRFRALRQKDELKEFYEKFMKMIKKFRQGEKGAKAGVRLGRVQAQKKKIPLKKVMARKPKKKGKK